MDAIEVLTNLDSLTPFYQPIFSADEHVVVAYEISGKLWKNEEWIMLNHFPYDEEIPEEYRLEVQHKILHKALAELEIEPKNFDIYLPCNANLLVLDYGESFFDIIKQYISEEELSRIVIVLSEHNYKGDFNQLQNILRYYKTYGVKVAINQVGSESHLDYIKMLSPNILKVNIEQLSYESWGAQNDLFTSLSALARKIGANMLFEGIDTVHQLQFAWKNSGRYYQGKYLAKAATGFIPREQLKNSFKERCRQFIATEKRLLEENYKTLKQLEAKLEGEVQRVMPTSKSPELLLELARELEDCTFRFYICDEKGFQKSPNII